MLASIETKKMWREVPILENDTEIVTVGVTSYLHPIVLYGYRIVKSV